MKEAASQVPAPAPERSSDLGQRAPAPEREAGARELGPALLDRLVERAPLEQAWEAATAEGGEALSGRADHERRLGVSLAQVRVHRSGRARRFLDRLGASGASRGSELLLGDTSTETLAHELVHVLQARGEGGGGTLVGASHEAEHEAEALARGQISVRQLRARLPGRAIALRRLQLSRDPAPNLPPALGVEELQEVPEAEVVVVEAPPEQAQEGGEAQELAPREGAAEPAEPEVAEASQDSAQAAAPEAIEAPELAPAGESSPAASPDRQQEVGALLEEQQEAWDADADTASGHEVEPCPRSAVGNGEQPFARGPPLEVPETTAAPEVEQPELEAPDGSALVRAEGAVQRQLDQAPASNAGVDQGAVDPDTDRERASEQARVRREVDRELQGYSFDEQETPAVDTEGRADPEARGREAEARAEAAATTQGERARLATREDMGEARLAPVQDPTEGHDTELESLRVPEVDVAAQVDEAAQGRIATEGNVGQVGLDEVVLVRDEGMGQAEALARERGERRQQLDEEIDGSQERLQRMCREGQQERARVRQDSERQVGERRRTWEQAVDQRVGERETEAGDLVREGQAHALGLQREADQQAEDTLREAHQERDSRWREVGERARAKAGQSEDRSWWQRSVDWVRARIADLVRWIDGFIDAAHRAIDLMLDAASAVAHAYVEAGHRAVSATLDLMHAGVDLIADNLPGELGEIAREHRDELHGYLDGVQAQVDGWAEDLHQGIDEEIEGLRDGLHEGLEDIREGVHEVAEAVDTLLEDGLMALIRQHFPALGAFIDEGILGPINRAGEQLQAWADSALEATGLGRLEGLLTEVHQARFCQAQTEEEQAEDCAAFEARLQGLLAQFDAILESPLATRIQGFLAEGQENQAQGQAEAISTFMGFIRQAAEPVYQWWQRVEPKVSEAMEWLGEMASAAWQHIAGFLGLDLSLPPLEAIRQGLERAWQAIVEAVQPLVDRIRQAWTWITEQSPLAPIIAFIGAIPGVVSAIGGLLSQMGGAAMDWIATAAQALRDTIMPAIEAALGAVGGAITAVSSTIASWADRLLSGVDAFLAWEPVHALLNLVMRAVRVWATPIRLAMQLFRDCGVRAMEELAGFVTNLTSYVRIILDIATGIVQAVLFFPAGAVAFLVGNAWLYGVPDCYKAPILNFLLDLAIRTVQFFPEPADFMMGALYQGLLNFLQGLRAAPDEQKVAAIDLLASILGGNAEVAAGFLVGLVEGVWEATGGTIIFLLQAVVWLIALPFKLLGWAAGLLRGGGPDRGEATPDGTAEPEQPAGTLRRRRGRTDPPTPEALQSGAHNPRDGPVVEELERSLQRAPAQAREEGRRGRQGVEPTPEELAFEELPADEQPLQETDDAGAIDSAVQQVEDGAGEAGGDTGPVGEVDPDRPPETPSALQDLRGTLSQLMGSGFSAEDVRTALDGVRDTIRQFVGRLARQAAQALLGALNTQGAGFAIGRAMGSIVGQIVVELILAFFTGGASGAVTAAKVAIKGAQAAGKLASILRRIRSAVQPLLSAIGRMRGSLSRVFGSIRRWFDDVLRWMRGVGGRARGRLQRVGRAPGTAGPRPRAGGLRPRRAPGPARRATGPPRRSPAPARRPARPPRNGRTPNRRRPRDRQDHGRPGPLELRTAMAMAKGLSDRLEAAGMTVSQTVASLGVLRQTFPWIRGFRARPMGAGRHRIILLASEHPVDVFGDQDEDSATPRLPRRRRPRNSRPPARGSADLDLDSGLTPAQRDWFRARIDAIQATSPAQADRLRYQRYRLGQIQQEAQHGPVPLNFRTRQTRGQHRVSGNRLRGNSRRGRVHEQSALDDLGVPNNNATNPVTHTHSGVTTRPDGVTSRGGVIEVKSTSGVQYQTQQIRTQQHLSSRHSTVITGGPSSGVRPSGPLANTSRVLHRDPSTGAWSMWDRHLGGWRPISARSARRLVNYR